MWTTYKSNFNYISHTFKHKTCFGNTERWTPEIKYCTNKHLFRKTSCWETVLHAVNRSSKQYEGAVCSLVLSTAPPPPKMVKLTLSSWANIKAEENYVPFRACNCTQLNACPFRRVRIPAERLLISLSVLASVCTQGIGLEVLNGITLHLYWRFA